MLSDKSTTESTRTAASFAASAIEPEKLAQIGAFTRALKALLTKKLIADIRPGAAAAAEKPKDTIASGGIAEDAVPEARITSEPKPDIDEDLASLFAETSASEAAVEAAAFDKTEAATASEDEPAPESKEEKRRKRAEELEAAEARRAKKLEEKKAKRAEKAKRLEEAEEKKAKSSGAEAPEEDSKPAPEAVTPEEDFEPAPEAATPEEDFEPAPEAEAPEEDSEPSPEAATPEDEPAPDAGEEKKRKKAEALEAKEAKKSKKAEKKKAKKAEKARRLEEAEEKKAALSDEEAPEDEIPFAPEPEAAGEPDIAAEPEDPAATTPMPKHAKADKLRKARDGKLRDIYLLYAPCDRVLAYKLTCLLEKNGLTCVMGDRDFARDDASPAETRVKAMSLCRMALVVMSENSGKYSSFVQDLVKAKALKIRFALFKRQEISGFERFDSLLKATPVINGSSFSPERTLMVVNAVLNSVKYSKTRRSKVPKKAKHKTSVVNLDKIYHSPLHYIGNRLLPLLVTAYLLITAIAFLPEFGRDDWLFKQFPSATHPHGAIYSVFAYIQKPLPFELSVTALTSALASLAVVIASLPFTRYLIRKASAIMLALNTAVLTLTVYSVLNQSKDLINLLLKVLPLIVVMLPLIVILILSIKLTRTRR